MTSLRMSMCHICAAGEVRGLPEFASLARVTSDCKPWPAGGRLGICRECGTVQKFVDDQWRADIAGIYADYKIYFQAGGGAEQSVFLGERAQPMTRSEWLVRQVTAHASLPAEGRLLDIGCGNGAFLRGFSRAMPGWRLTGTELSDATRDIVLGIPGVEAFHSGPLEDVSGRFDMISLVHVLEHISEPVPLLCAVADKLKPGGIVFVEVPDIDQNPFDLVIADHVTHFTPSTFARFLSMAGYAIGILSHTWVVKEISALATFVDGHAAPRPSNRVLHTIDGLDWLLATRAAARAARDSAAGPFGLFGSSPAATWLAHEVDCAMEFFVDEDPYRQGQRFTGRPVIGPDQVVPRSVVFIGVGGGLSEPVARRLSERFPLVRWVPAPPLH